MQLHGEFTQFTESNACSREDFTHLFNTHTAHVIHQVDKKRVQFVTNILLNSSYLGGS